MKTTTAGFLTAQTAPHVEPKFLMYLFEQWDYAISDRDNATTIQVTGNASSWLSNGDVFIIPFDDFDTYHTITSAPSYNAGTGKTTIVCSASTFGTDVVGMYIAQRTDVTDDVMERGFSEIRISTEDETLNSSLADDVQIALDNADQAYWNADGSSGLFNSGRIFWVQIIFYLNGNATTFLVFGGNIYLPSIQPVSHLQTVEFICHGHLKEMERYPGFRLTIENGKLPKIPGITLVSITEPSGGIIEALRDIKLRYPDGTDIKNLIINTISTTTLVGWHVIKYQPPDLFQYDFGSWTQLVEAATSQTLTAAKGHTINIDMPKTFDIEAREDWFYLASRTNLFHEAIGKFSIEYSEGKKIVLRPTIDRVIFHDDSGASYSDITRYANDPQDNETAIVGSADDEIWIMTKEPICGVYLDLNSDLVGTITWYYSTNYNTYATLTKTDGTSNLSTSGAVTWSIPADHKQIDDLIDSVIYQNYYIIKVKCTAYTSGDCAVRRILKHLQLIGNDNSKLNIQINYEHLPIQDREDTVVLRDNSSAVMTPCVWKENYSVYQQLKAMLTEAEYTAGNQSLGNLYHTLASKTVSLYGRPPFHHYGKKPTALCVGAYPLLYGGFKLFLGVEDELWSFDLENGYQYIDKLDPYIRAADGAFFKLEIRKLIMDGAGYLQGIAWKSYFDQPIYGQEYSDDIDIGRRTPAVVFRSTTLASITEQNEIDSGGNSIFTSQETCWRDGLDDSGIHYIGQWGAGIGDRGENVCLPFQQQVWDLESPHCRYENRNSVTHNTTIGTDYSIRDVFGAGHYAFLRDPGSDIGLCFTWGQAGFVVWDEGNDRWGFVKWTGAAWKLASVTYAGTVSDLLELTDYVNQILAGCFYNSKFYYALMEIDENGGTFPGDYSDCSLKRVDSDGSNDTTLFAFASDSVEANQSLTASTDEVYSCIIDMVYNEDDATIHGCILNRFDFEYHYFVYDVTNDKMYTSQTGTGFTFNAHRQIKNFVFNNADDKVYATVVDLRNKQEIPFIISAEFTAPVGAADGTEITLTFEADLVAGDYDVRQMIVDTNGVLYGITGPEKNYLFQYDENVYPIMFFNDSAEDNFHDVLNDLAQVMNMVHVIAPERKLYFKGRESNIGSMTITEADYYLQDTMAPIRNWNHYYDGVEVSWENPLTGESGVERSGVFGWNRRVLKINNRFIQYPQLAKVVADQYADFYDHYRRELSFQTMLIYQLECRDKFQFSHSVNRFDFATATWWMIEELILNYWDFTDVIRAIEIA